MNDFEEICSTAFFKNKYELKKNQILYLTMDDETFLN